MPDSLRLALGTFTALPVPAPRRVDRAVARGAMLTAPLVGLLLALVLAAPLAYLRTRAGGAEPELPDLAEARAWFLRSVGVDLLGATLVVAALAVLTRGIHLDGLADTADGWGAKATDAAGRLAVMRRPDTGAFGLVAVALVLLLQVAALTMAALVGYGTDALVTAVVAGRLAATWCAVRGVPSARPDGLGAAVAGSVPRTAAVLATLAVLGVVLVAGLLDDDVTEQLVLVLPLSVLAGLGVCAVVVRWAVRALGGITGDVVGAAVELTTATVLVVVAIAA